MADRFVFTITTGRSGTTYLAELLARNVPDSRVWHERTSFQSFGVDTPDLSHFTLFNSVGNVPKVQGFWRRKFARDRKTDRTVHGEASHLLAKAGLLENIGMLTNSGATVDVVILKRDVADTVWSFYNRFDLVNNGLPGPSISMLPTPTSSSIPNPLSGTEQRGVDFGTSWKCACEPPTTANYWRVFRACDFMRPIFPPLPIPGARVNCWKPWTSAPRARRSVRDHVTKVVIRSLTRMNARISTSSAQGLRSMKKSLRQPISAVGKRLSNGAP